MPARQAVTIGLAVIVTGVRGVTARGNAHGCEKKGLRGKQLVRVWKQCVAKSAARRHKPVERKVGVGWGYRLRGDRKSAEAIENRRDSGAPLRKRVRNRMKLQGLRG